MKWSQKEIKFLKNNYKCLKYAEISQKLGRSIYSVESKISRLKLNKTKKWSKKEIIRNLREFAKENKPTYSNLGKKRKDLLESCKRYFGSLNKAKKVAGLKIILNKYIFPKSIYKPSKELAWIVGYILGDGWVSTWILGTSTKDADLKNYFIKTFKKWSDCKHFYISKKEGESKFPKGVYECNPYWIIRINSVEINSFLKKFKNNPLYCLKFFPKNYWNYILKGLWDAEGYVSPKRNGLHIGFSNTNKDILKLYEELCKSLNFNPCISKGEIIISNMPDVLRFVDEIRITISRKLKKIEQKINKAKELRKIYYQVLELKNRGLGAIRIWKEINKKVSLRRIEGWIYLDHIPYPIRRKNE